MATRRALIRAFILYAVSFICLFLSVSLYFERELDSDIFGDWSLAMLFGAVPAVIGYAVFLFVAFIVRLFAEILVWRKIRHPLIGLWVGPLVGGIVIASILISQHRSSSKLITDYLGIVVPPSVSEFHYWWGILPGDAEFVFKFKINPGEFDQLLACRKFTKVTDSNQIDDETKKLSNLIGFRHDLAPPAHAPIIYHYEDDSTGLPHIVTIWPMDDRGEVVIYGDN